MQAAALPTFQQQYQGNSSGVSGQFVCPTHGAAGLPHFDAAGNPICPFGDQIMWFNSMGKSTINSTGNSMGSKNYALAAGG